MKVTNVDDNITHAVIGSGSVESFGMSEDAELYHILSSALYSRKKEAAIREILCNGWDAHIEHNVKRPMEIIMDHESFMLRDFGPGIAHENIKPIYGTYGSSTKLKNALVTGGFGLGTKAPFSYADHFEVTSHFDGTENIYRMSKSNAEVGGKPSINHILGVPTDETGLSVKFDIKSREDYREFLSLIKNIVAMGGMNVLLNGEKLPAYPFDEMTEDFMLIKDRSNEIATDGEKLRVRYGHVSYPIPDHPRYQGLKEDLKNFLSSGVNRSLAINYYNSDDWAMILQAPAHGITVTPSRESISLTDTSVETLYNMLNGLALKMETKFRATVERMYFELLDCIPCMERPAILYDKSPQVPLQGMIEANSDYIASFDQLGQYYLSIRYPDHPGFEEKAQRARFDILARLNPKAAMAIRSWQKHKKYGPSSSYRRNPNREWFVKNVYWRALKGGEKFGIKPGNLVVRASATQMSRSNRTNFTLSTLKDANLSNMLDFLRGFVVIAHNTSPENIERAHRLPIMKWFGVPTKMLVYKVSRNKKTIAKAIQHFEQRGFHVIDLTKVQSWETPEAVAPVKPVVKTKTVKGLPRLFEGLEDPKSNYIETARIFEDDTRPRLDAPKLIVQIAKNAKSSNRFNDLSSTVCGIIARRWGREIGVVQNSRQGEVYAKKGAEYVNSWLYNKLLEEYKTNPAIKTHYENSINHLDDSTRLYVDLDIVAIVRLDPELQKHFKIEPPADQDTLDIIAIYNSFPSYERRYNKQLKEIEALIKTWTLNKPMVKLLKKLKSNPLVDCLDGNRCRSIILNIGGGQKAADITAVRNIVRNAIER